MRRVLLIKGVGRYDVLRHLTDHVGEAFRSMGCTCHTVDVGPDNPARVRELSEAVIGFRPDLAFSFNAQGLGMIRIGGDDLFARHGVLFHAFMVDDPAYHAFRFSDLSRPGITVSWIDLQWAAAAQRLGVMNSVFVPHAGRVLPEGGSSERPIDVLLPGSLEDPDEIRAAWRESLSPRLVRVMDEVAEAWEADPLQPWRVLLHRALMAQGVPATEEAQADLENGLAAQIISFVRNRLRLAVVRALKDLPLTVCGGGPWRRLVGDGRYTVMDSLPFPDVERLIRRSKVLLNATPFLVDGVTERVFTGLLNGAVVLTNENRFMNASFRPGVEFASYRFDSLADLADRVASLLADGAAREEMAERGRQAAAREHTWLHRAQRILDLTGRAEEARAAVAIAVGTVAGRHGTAGLDRTLSKEGPA